MTVTDTSGRLSFIRAGMGYLNADSHKAGIRKALTSAGVYALPSASGSRKDALDAALGAYPEWNHVLHDRNLKAAVIAAAEVWTA